MDANDSDLESDFDLWDEPGIYEQYVVASLPIGARRTENNISHALNVPGILNDDCWRYILDYLSLEEIEWSKSVSREWHAMVHRYMEGVRLRVETISSVWDVDEQIRRRKCRVLTLHDPVCLAAALNRWGASVRELVYDAKADSHPELRGLGEQCPNLEDITLVRLRWYYGLHDWAANFRNLKRVCFENSLIVDSCISEFLKNNTIEELVIRMTESFSGSFLVAESENVLRKLKTLVLSNCLDLNLSNLLLAAESGNLTEVTKLELRYCRRNLTMRMDSLLDNMPQLKHLTLDCEADLLDEGLVGAVLRLERLEHLGWLNGAEFRGEKLRDVRKNASWLFPRLGPAPALHAPRLPNCHQVDAAFQLRLEHARQSYLRWLQEHRRLPGSLIERASEASKESLFQLRQHFFRIYGYSDFWLYSPTSQISQPILMEFCE